MTKPVSDTSELFATETLPEAKTPAAEAVVLDVEPAEEEKAVGAVLPAAAKSRLPEALAGDLPPKDGDGDSLTLAHYARAPTWNMPCRS